MRTYCFLLISLCTLPLFALTGCTPGIAVSATSHTFSLTEDTWTFDAWNVAYEGETVALAFATNRNWLTVAPANATSTGPDDPVEVTVTVQRDQLAKATLDATIFVTSDQDDEIDIAIEVETTGGGEGEGEGEMDYRQEMRDFVQAISAYAKSTRSDFLIVPQNGEALLTATGEPDGAPSLDYLAAIDGQGREDVFYGYDNDNTPTPSDVTEAFVAMLGVAEVNNVQVLVTDYCWTQNYMEQSYLQNSTLGFVSFAATHRDLDNIPDFPSPIFFESDDDIATLADASNMLYLINPGEYPSAEAFIAAVSATNYDLLIADAFYDDAMLTPAQVAALKLKANGGARLVIAYMSIGEAEDYRYYWQSGWHPGTPSWLAAENPDWEGNYKVRYWDPGWQAIIFGGENAYLDRIMAAGFDGVYLDIIDAYEYFEE